MLECLKDSMSRRSFILLHRLTQHDFSLTDETTATKIGVVKETEIDTEHQFALSGAAFFEDEYVRPGGH